MTPAALAARLEGLRRAGAALRQRPAQEVLDVGQQVLDAWCAADSPWRTELAASLPSVTGFAPATVHEGLERGFGAWRDADLRGVAERELGALERRGGDRLHRVTGFEVTSVLLAGSIPMPTLLALLAPLMLRSPVLAKTASRDSVTAPLVARSIAAVDPELGRCIEVVSFPGDDDARMDAFLAADCVAAMGSDETIAALARRIRPQQRLIARGHRVSLAALGPEATRGEALERAARGLALDTALWDQLGCLSPIAVYAVSADRDAADRVAQALANALADAQRRWPRGQIDVAAATLIAHERAEAEVCAAAGQRVALHASDDTSWTVVRHASAEPRSAPFHRFLRVHPLGDAKELPTALEPLSPHLAAVALAGFADQTEAVTGALANLGASRICRPGSLQSPPLDWPHDGQGLLLPFARSTSLEVGELAQS